MKRIGLLLLIVGIPWLILAGTNGFVGVVNFSHNIDQTVDTAQVVTFYGFTAMDSFTYLDSINDSTITYTSPLQTMVLTPSIDTSLDFEISVVFAGGDSLTASWDPSAGYDTLTLAAFIDSLVASFNGATNLTDSIDAQDSASYIKLVSLFGQETFTARWYIGLLTGFSDSSTTVITKAEIVDTMVALINADSGLLPVVTAASLDDTAFQVTSDLPGLAFTFGIGDTAIDSTTTTANASGVSLDVDTFELPAICCDVIATGARFKIVILPPNAADSAGGYGAAGDSFHVYLETYAADGSNADFHGLARTLAADTFNATPCSLEFALPEAAGTDTLLYKNVRVIIWNQDSASVWSPAIRNHRCDVTWLPKN